MEEILDVWETYMAIFWPIPGFKIEDAFQLWVLNREDL